MTIPDHHAEVCITILNHIAEIDGLKEHERIELGLQLKDGWNNLLCNLYSCKHCGSCEYCPGRRLCRRAPHTHVLSRSEWVNAYRYHAGRAD